MNTIIPKSILESLPTSLNSQISEAKLVTGGDINKAAKIELSDGKKFFLKWNLKAPANFFSVEAKGLETLKAAKTHIVIPNVIDIGSSHLVLEWLEHGEAAPNSCRAIGEGLAQMHKVSHEFFGLDYQNYIGTLVQKNAFSKNWLDFYISQRIEPQIKMAVDSNKLDTDLAHNLDSFTKNISSLLPIEKPSLIHGDLWSGNFMTLIHDEVSIFDPAIYYGHREMDLAMSHLFGGFSKEFYRAYESEFPLEPGFKERITIHQLYPILVHVNLFGGGYIQQAKSIIQHFS